MQISAPGSWRMRLTRLRLEGTNCQMCGERHLFPHLACSGPVNAGKEKDRIFPVESVASAGGKERIG